MKQCLAVSILLAAGSLSAADLSAVTPVQKVIQLMNGMLEKGKKEKHDEQVQFAAYKQFCDDTAEQKKTAISKANEKIEVLKADIQKAIASSRKLGKEIAEHDEDISVWNGDVKATTKVRSLESADYNALHKDYSESIDALQRAIAVLKKQAYDRKQASFVQVSALTGLSLIPQEAKQTIEAFLGTRQEPDGGLAVTAPEAYGYEFQSHSVVAMLEKLLDKFNDELTVLEKEEMNTKHAFEMLVQDLTAQIEQATQDSMEKSALKAKASQAKADAEGDLEDTTTTRDADVKYLADLTATCEQKATDFVARQELRDDEFVAIEKAIVIISSSSVSGNADKYLPGFLQESTLAQLRADGRSPSQQQVASYLQKQARQLNSRVLSALAVRVAADPFKKVKKMIKDLIVRLMEEATDEAEHKGWCDTELSTNEHTRKQKTESVELLHAEIDQLGASIAKLSEEIVALTTAVAELDAAMAEATKLRAGEKEKNLETVKDAQEAQTAVAQALVVLKEFYAKAGEATALIQQQPTPPPIFENEYKGMQAENGGVVGMLEVIELDFARLEADTKAAEVAAQKAYDNFMTDSKVDKAAKTKDIEHRTAKKQDQEHALSVKGADLEGTQKELDAALGYFDKLKPSCIDAGVSYDDRVMRRKEEIESLQDALRILNGEDFA